MESFSSSTCGPCAGGNVNVRSVLAANPGKAIKLAFQQNYPPAGDPYFTAETRARHDYYGIMGISHMTLDGGCNGFSSVLTSKHP